MTRSELLARLGADMEELFEIPPDKVVPEARLYEDLDLDSIDAVDLLVRLRELTGRRIDPEEYKTVRTVGDVLDRIIANGSSQIPLKRAPLEPGVAALRAKYPNLNDEERLLRHLYAGTQVDDMRAAGAMKTEYEFDQPIVRLLKELPDGYCEAEMTYASDEWLTRQILGFGADVQVLARGLVDFYRTGRTAALDSYSATALRRVWQAQHFSWWMTSLLHRAPNADAFQHRLQLAQLDQVCSSPSAARLLAENYVGLFGP